MSQQLVWRVGVTCSFSLEEMGGRQAAVERLLLGGKRGRWLLSAWPLFCRARDHEGAASTVLYEVPNLHGIHCSAFYRVHILSDPLHLLERCATCGREYS